MTLFISCQFSFLKCCALSFVEDMTAQSIGMDDEEFDSYLSGRVVPPGSWQSSLLMCQSLQAMSQVRNI